MTGSILGDGISPSHLCLQRGTRYGVRLPRSQKHNQKSLWSKPLGKLVLDTRIDLFIALCTCHISIMARADGRTRQMVDAAMPEAFLFCVVAKCGPDGTHRPLAILQHCPADRPEYCLAGADLLLACERAIAAFSSPINTAAIQTEVACATDFYRSGPGLELDRFEAVSPIEVETRDEGCADERGIVPEGGLEFPITARRLADAISFNPENGRQYSARFWPLGSTYNHKSFGQGLIVFDVSDCGHIRWGIYAFRAEWYGWVVDDPEYGWDPAEDEPPVDSTRAMLDPTTTVTRTPQSAREYYSRTNFGQMREFDQAIVDRLDRQPLLDASASNCKHEAPVSTRLRSNSKLTYF